MATSSKAKNNTSLNEDGKEIPRYELTEKAYINDVLLEVGQEVDYEGVPGHHMEPVNDSARAAKAVAPVYMDPILALTAIN